MVIPKEIRRTQLIRVGDPLEIFVSGEGEVIFKKYSPVGEMGAFAQLCADVLQKNAGVSILVTDRDRTVAAAPCAHDAMERRVTTEYEQLAERRRYCELETPVPVCGGKDAPAVSAVAPVLCEGDLIGTVALLDAPCTETGASLVRTVAALLGRQLET